MPSQRAETGTMLGHDGTYEAPKLESIGIVTDMTLSAGSDGGQLSG